MLEHLAVPVRFQCRERLLNRRRRLARQLSTNREHLRPIPVGGRNIGVGLHLFKKNPSLSAPPASQGELRPDQLASSPQRWVTGCVSDLV